MAGVPTGATSAAQLAELVPGTWVAHDADNSVAQSLHPASGSVSPCSGSVWRRRAAEDTRIIVDATLDEPRAVQDIHLFRAAVGADGGASLDATHALPQPTREAYVFPDSTPQLPEAADDAVGSAGPAIDQPRAPDAVDAADALSGAAVPHPTTAVNADALFDTATGQGDAAEDAQGLREAATELRTAIHGSLRSPVAENEGPVPADDAVVITVAVVEQPIAVDDAHRPTDQAGHVLLYHTSFLEAVVVAFCLRAVAASTVRPYMVTARSIIAALRIVPFVVAVGFACGPRRILSRIPLLSKVHRFAVGSACMKMRFALAIFWAVALCVLRGTNRWADGVLMMDFFHSLGDAACIVAYLYMKKKLALAHLASPVQQAVAPEVATSVPMDVFTCGEAGSYDDDTSGCVICLNPLVQGDQAARLQCGHTFHEQCVAQWLQHNRSCPLRCPQAVILGPPTVEGSFSANAAV